MKTWIFLAFLLTALSIVNESSAAEYNAKSLFPLEKGSYWLYKGNIRWTPEGENQKVKSKVITWKMTIHEVFESARVKVALVTGFPNDVAWYEEGMTPKYSLLAQTEDAVLWNGYETEKEALEAAKAIVAKGIEAGPNLKTLLEFPLIEGKRYDVTDESRTDNMYAWNVEKVGKAEMKVKGIKPGAYKKSTLVYRTLPDHIIVEFFDSIGIGRYVYKHHGTEAFEDLRLVEYGSSKKSTPNKKDAPARKPARRSFDPLAKNE